MKMPGSSGVFTVMGDTGDALTDLRLTFKATAASRPATGSAPEGSGAAPMKKKPLFSQDRAGTKQVSVDEDGESGATFTIGTGLPRVQEESLVGFLHANKDVFAWQATDLVGVPQGVIEHHLMVCPNAHPVKQKVRRQASKK